MRVRAVVPATCANLGPGFDCLGLAVDLCNEVILDTEREPAVSWEGEGADELPTDGSDMIGRAMRRTERVAGASGRRLPPSHLHGVNRIPLARGLGSSSAAAVAGVALALTLLEPDADPDPQTVFSIAAALEGHPDNAAAAVHGGLTLVVGDGVVSRFSPHPSLQPVLLIPERARVSTELARRVLPDQVSFADAAFNAGHAALTSAALLEGRVDLLVEALRDRLHQDARLGLIPEARTAFDRMTEAGVPVCVSGSGPSLLAFEGDGVPAPDPGPGWRVLRPGLREAGLVVVRG